SLRSPSIAGSRPSPSTAAKLICPRRPTNHASSASDSFVLIRHQKRGEPAGRIVIASRTSHLYSKRASTSSSTDSSRGNSERSQRSLRPSGNPFSERCHFSPSFFHGIWASIPADLLRRCSRNVSAAFLRKARKDGVSISAFL